MHISTGLPSQVPEVLGEAYNRRLTGLNDIALVADVHEDPEVFS